MEKGAVFLLGHFFFYAMSFCARSIRFLKFKMFQRVLEVFMGYLCCSDSIIGTAYKAHEKLIG